MEGMSAMQTIAAAAEALASGTTTSVKMAEACLARATDPSGEGKRVFIALSPDKVRAQAAASDALRRHGVVPSPLAGVPVSVKDLYDVQGEVTAAGSKALADSPPAVRDAPAIARLRAAGAVLMGRTNMTEFAYSGVGLNPHYGTPSSPWDRKTGRIPGGSSSGAAVSVADGMAIAGLGTDTGGSCRIPAALCGTVGWKPTARRIPLDGVTPLAFSLDSLGSMGASVGCVALIDQIMAGEPVRLLTPPTLRGRRLGVLKTVVLEGMDPQVAQSYQRSLSALSKAGALLIDVAIPAVQRMPIVAVKGGLAGAEASGWHKDLIAAKGNLYDPRVRTRIELGFTQSAADYLGAVAARRVLIDAFDAATLPFDALVMPTCPIIAPPLAAFDKDEEFGRINQKLLRNTLIGNVMDRCSISLPCHRPGEACVGLMLVGERGADHALLSLSAAIEAVLATTQT
jgi:aspartyl-tRNA(Asn)/glutamyl-tRNA(Gln) amidotransferase subunit A